MFFDIRTSSIRWINQTWFDVEIVLEKEDEYSMKNEMLYILHYLFLVVQKGENLDDNVYISVVRDLICYHR